MYPGIAKIPIEGIMYKTAPKAPMIAPEVAPAIQLKTNGRFLGKVIP